MRNRLTLQGKFPWKLTLVCFCISFIQLSVSRAENNVNISEPLYLTCDNVTDGGSIEGDEEGCPDPVYDPAEIVNVVMPSGGSGCFGVCLDVYNCRSKPADHVLVTYTRF